jgi:hypothetical protein
VTGRKAIQFLFYFLILFLPSVHKLEAGLYTNFSVSLSPYPDATNFNAFVQFSIIDDTTDGSPPQTPPVPGNLISITNDTENLPFQIIFQQKYSAFYEFQFVLPPDILSKTYTMTWSNFSFTSTLGTAVFLTSPQNRSVFVSNTVTFAAQAFHTTGYQWQRNGTNLVEDGHFVGVTNTMLTIGNVQLSDAGRYTVIANNPDMPGSAQATLGVFKPVRLGLTASSTNSSFVLTVANQDGSSFDASQIPSVQIFSSTNLSLNFSNWTRQAFSGFITNGILQSDVSNDGSGCKFWRLFEAVLE